MDNIQLTLTEIMKVTGFIILVAGAINGVIFAILRAKFVPRSFIFCPKDGTPIYRTIEECIKMEDERKEERRERDKRIEEKIEGKIEVMQKANERFLKDMKGLMDTQTKAIKDAFQGAVG